MTDSRKAQRGATPLGARLSVPSDFSRAGTSCYAGGKPLACGRGSEPDASAGKNLPGSAREGALRPRPFSAASAARTTSRRRTAWPAALAFAVAGVAFGADERSTVEQLHARIAASAQPREMKPYKTTIPGSDIAFEMLPIQGGEFVMGSDRPGEGPRHKVNISPFWMQKYEVTWDEYRLFMFANLANETAGKDAAVDAVSRPTKPYVEMSFGMGINGYPAISMTQHAANKYAQWLSAKTGQFYRLPTEAEWEYACLAGSDRVPAPLADYAVSAENSGGHYAKIGSKKPNPWGLHDMLGNVMEWTLDQTQPYTAAAATDPWVESKTPYPHTARGGSWNDKAPKLTCSARVGSDPSWKQQDPQLPKSIWYLTDAQWLGFRLVRPLKTPTAEQMYKYWNNGVETE